MYQPLTFLSKSGFRENFVWISTTYRSISRCISLVALHSVCGHYEGVYGFTILHHCWIGVRSIAPASLRAEEIFNHIRVDNARYNLGTGVGS